MAGLGKALCLMGLVLLVFGGLLIFGSHLPGIGSLPGDLVFRRGNLTVYFPLATSLLLSLILSLLVGLLGRR